VRLWLDARAPAIARVDAWRAALEDSARAVAAERRVEIALRTESRSQEVEFDTRVADALGGPRVVCFAGHDAGVLAPRIPAGMVLVRNPTGVSHSPAEAVDLADAAVAADAVRAALEELA
jgi:N-carbamoyl-L-amino-acid hydrolase